MDDTVRDVLEVFAEAQRVAVVLPKEVWFVYREGKRKRGKTLLTCAGCRKLLTGKKLKYCDRVCLRKYLKRKMAAGRAKWIVKQRRLANVR